MQYGGKIVTNGLIFCLDAGSEKTYLPISTIPVTSGLVMWMDAADDSVFTYSSGTTVSQWRDKSSSGYHMTPKSGGPTRSAFLNSRNVLTFTNSQTIGNNTINLVSSSYSVFLVSRLTGGANSRTLTADFNLSGSNWLLGGWSGSVNQYYAEGWVQSGNYTANTAWSINMGDRNAASDQASFYLNGSAIVTNSAGSGAGPNSLGINWFSSEMSNCEVAEIIVYNKILSETERRLVHTYLARKWNLSNGEAVLFDRSGSRYNADLTNGASLDTSNGGCISFDGSNDCVVVSSNASIIPTTAYTKTAWFYPTSYSVANNIISGGNSGQHAFWLAGGNKLNSGHNGNWSTVVSNTTILLNTWYYGAVTFNTTSGWVLYVNGIQEATSASTTTFGGGGEILIGAYGTGSNIFQGKIAVVNVYNRALSASEVLQNFTATRGRFGL